MLPLILPTLRTSLTCLLISTPLTTARPPTTATLCSTGAANLTSNPSPYSIYLDSDPAFISITNSTACVSTSQKFIYPGWQLAACYVALTSTCGSAKPPESYNVGLRSFASSIQNGAACQAVLYQPTGIDGVGGARTLGQECCLRNFEQAATLLYQNGSDTNAAADRASINIAIGGFPHTEGYLKDPGTTPNNVFMPVDAKLPSFILQGWVDCGGGCGG